MSNKTVSLDWVLNQLAGRKFPDRGQAHDFIKCSAQELEQVSAPNEIGDKLAATLALVRKVRKRIETHPVEAPKGDDR